MNLTIITPPATFWDTKSDLAYPALLQYGYNLFQQIADPTKFLRIIDKSVLAVSGYTFIQTIPANSGFSNTGNTLLQPTDAGLEALATEYGLPYPTMTYAQLKAIDTTIIPKKDFQIDNSGEVIKNMASQPYENVTYEGAVVVYVNEKVTSIK